MSEHRIGAEGEAAAHPVPRDQRIGTYCEDYELFGCPVAECPKVCYLQ